MRSRTIAVTALATTALCALSACAPVGGGDKAAEIGSAARASAGATAGTPAPSASASARAGGPGDFSDLSAAEILTRSHEATSKAESVHVKAKVTEEGKPMEIDLSLDKKGSCNGVIRLDGMGALTVIKSPDLIHFKGDAAYWRGAAKMENAPRKQTDQMVATLADRWVKVPTSDPRAAAMTTSCDLDKLTGGTGKASPLARKGAATVVDGTPAITITSPVRQGTAVDCVATQGTPYLLKSTVFGDSDGEILFSDYGKPVDTTSPKDADVLDLSKQGGGVPGEAA
ncbi:hypothetical protein ACFWUZ_05500 [Streptomyces sp. NPDC058646]|uniref:hypothetical protein n=1 Tax=Streptomyces sp. NPDC058646 TaxID=3346574 RepID=UPI003648498C